MYLDIFGTIINAIGEVASMIGIGWLAVIGLGLLALLIIISFLVTQFSIELKTARAVAKINKYLELNPFVNEDNLVEFNKLMKRIPAPMRLQWQQYMVNRDKRPSEFFTDDNCIEKPFKSSAYGSQIFAVKVGIICLSVLMLIFNLSYYTFINEPSILTGILSSILLSTGIIFIGTLYLFFLKARRNSSLSDLYFNFVNFQKYLDRACSTLPDYVDYEILFTRKEITSGIPVLQEYLQQRALFEQEQIKKAQESQVVHEQYDFSALGINGSLVMESSMRESEYVIGNKNRIYAEISELQGAMDMLNKSYDEKNKNSQRKLRDIQDSLDRLKEKLDNTTNLIVGNDLRKQRENEIQKQRQLEKEADEDNKKYEADKKQLEEQIAAKRAEIDNFKTEAENRINGEFKAYADKIYKELREVVEAQVKEEVANLHAEKNQLEQELEEKERLYVEKSTVYEEKAELCEQYEKHIEDLESKIGEAEKIKEEFDQYSSEKDQEIFETKKELESRNLELDKKNEIIQVQKEEIKELKHKKQIIVNRYFDTNGNEIFFDDDGRSYIVDPMGSREYLSLEQNSENNDNQDFEQIYNEKEEAVEIPQEVEFEINDNEILEALGENPEEVKEQRKNEEMSSLEDLKSQFHKPVYDFQWENSNANNQQMQEGQQDLREDEVVIENQQDIADKNSDEAKLSVEDKEIDEIDKLIEEQKVKLEKQNQTLSKQLEKTKKVADEDVNKKTESKKSVKNATKKTTSKKSSQQKKVEKPSKKEVEKKEPKKSTAKKTTSKKDSVKKSSAKKTKQSQEIQSIDIDLEKFNNQLNKAIKNIDDGNDKK